MYKYDNFFIVLITFFDTIAMAKILRLILRPKEALISPNRKRENTNMLELIEVKFPITASTKGTSVKTIHFKIRYMSTLTYMVKMERARSQLLLHIAKKIWNNLFTKQCTLNVQTVWKSRNQNHSSDLKLDPKIFSQIVKIRDVR